MTVAAVASRLEVSAYTVYSLISTGRLACHRVGTGRGVLRITEQQLQDYLEASEQKARRTPQPASRNPPAPAVRLAPKPVLKNFTL